MHEKCYMMDDVIPLDAVSLAPVPVAPVVAVLQ